MSYKKSFYDVSSEINEKLNARVNRTNTWRFQGDHLELWASLYYIYALPQCLLSLLMM